MTPEAENPKKRKFRRRSEMTPEERLAANSYQKEWRRKNAEKYYRMQRERRASDDGKYKKWSADWREKNREILNAKARDYRNRNVEKCRQKFKRYQDKNRAKLYEKWGFNRATEFGCKSWDRDAIIAVYQRAIDLSKQTGIRWSVDHIIPIALGGPHCPENVQAMPRAANEEKSGNSFWLCDGTEFKDWRSVPRSIWPEKFTRIYEAVIRHHESQAPFLTRTA